MYQQYWRQTPAALEQTLLAELQRQNQQFLNFICSLFTSQFMPPEALAHILYSIDQYEQSLYGFVPQANQLSSQGFPQLAQQLNFTFRDLSGARMTYAQMYQQELRHDHA